MKKALAVGLLILGGTTYNLAVSALSVIVFLLGILFLGPIVYLAIPAMWVPLGMPIKKLCLKYESKYDIKSPIFFSAAQLPSCILASLVVFSHDLSSLVSWIPNPALRQLSDWSVTSLFVTAPGLLLSVLLQYFVFDKSKPKGGAL